MIKLLRVAIVVLIGLFIGMQIFTMQYESAYQEGFDAGVAVQIERYKNELP